MPEAVNYIDLRGTRGDIIRLYDPDCVVLIQEGPPTLVVGTGTCTLGLHSGGGLHVGMSASLVMETLGIVPNRCLRLTEPNTGLVIHVVRPEQVMIVSGEKHTTLILKDFGVLVVVEKPSEVREAMEAWAQEARSKTAPEVAAPEVPGAQSKCDAGAYLLGVAVASLDGEYTAPQTVWNSADAVCAAMNRVSEAIAGLGGLGPVSVVLGMDVG